MTLIAGRGCTLPSISRLNFSEGAEGRVELSLILPFASL